MTGHGETHSLNAIKNQFSVLETLSDMADGKEPDPPEEADEQMGEESSHEKTEEQPAEQVKSDETEEVQHGKND